MSVTHSIAFAAWAGKRRVFAVLFGGFLVGHVISANEAKKDRSAHDGAT
jgi:hypothetical protein